MSEQAYPKYKPSRVEWLDEIPEDWEAKRLRFLVSEPLKYGANESAEIDDPNLPRYIRITDVDENGRLRDDTFKSLPEHVARQYLLKDGDLLLARSGATVGKSFYYEPSWGRAAYAGYLIRARFNPVRMISRFVHYFTNSQEYWQWLHSSFIQATIQNVSAEKYANLTVPVPPADEQRAIAAFLDRETERIDALIEKKQRQIELLQEKRSALISHAVTKGLDPNAKMKDSGIEWLGEVPEHWEVKRLKFLVSEPLKYGANEAAELDDPELPRYIRITDVDENGRLREETFKSIPEDVARPYLLKDGDLLLARSGATVGKSFYYEPSWGRAAYAGYLIRARFSPAKTMPRFVNYFTNSRQYWQWLNSSFIQATIQNVSAEKYANLTVPVPPFEEQKQIVSYLDSMWQKLSNMTDKVQQSIQVLKEYRSALISAAVTGKIDVRTVPAGRQEEVR